jgi:hypothetical protein
LERFTRGVAVDPGATSPVFSSTPFPSISRAWMIVPSFVAAAGLAGGFPAGGEHRRERKEDEEPPHGTLNGAGMPFGLRGTVSRKEGP